MSVCYSVEKKMDFYIAFSFLFLGIISTVCGQSCVRPEVTATSYTTQDATVLTNLAFITEFTLKCGNGVKGVSLHAEVDGKTLPGNLLKLVSCFLSFFYISNVKLSFFTFSCES